MKLKVALMNDSFPPIIDGVANTVKNYADIINEKYGEPLVITPRYPGIITEHNYKVLRYSSVNFFGRLPYRVGNPVSPSVIYSIFKEKPDLLHVHCPFASMSLARSINASEFMKEHIPVVFTYHTKFSVDIGKYVSSRPMKAVAQRYVLSNINYADEVWVVSEGAGRDLAEFGYTGEYLVMPNGTDFPHERASDERIRQINFLYDLPKDVPMFLFVGRMMWYKNLRLILDSLKKLADSDLKFSAVFVGDGGDKNEIVAYAKQLGLGDRCLFVGAVTNREKIRAFFSRADLLLFPSTYDTNGLVVREAAACDCAALLVKGSCAAEGVEDGVSGLLAEENADSCAEKLAALLRSGNFKELGKGAGNNIYYSWDEAVKKAWDRYEVILENKERKKESNV